jgi:hypothetical protein
MPFQPVLVDFKMRRDHTSEKQNEFWIKVTTLAQSETVHEIKVDLYQLDRECSSIHGIGLSPYPLENNHSYTFDFEHGDIVLVIVRYTEHVDLFTWKIAAQGVWISDGSYFRTGHALHDRSNLFAP